MMNGLHLRNDNDAVRAQLSISLLRIIRAGALQVMR